MDTKTNTNTKTNIKTNIKFLEKYPWAKKMNEQDWTNSKIYIDPDNTTVKKRQKTYDPNVPDVIPMELDINSLPLHEQFSLKLIIK